jgi:hypothetical protein|tara:strand:+ start:445 stop:582 length:138 start_codon:yes stop_codon:yes gene_type:complete
MTWKLKAFADPKLKHKDWMLLKLGPTNISDLIQYYYMKFKYTMFS